MRKIKFRGYSKEDNKWHYGYLLRSEKGYEIFDRHPFDGSIRRNEVIEDSIGQFTGFIDKNGKEIYEGDIVEYETSDEMDTYLYRAEVYFDDELGAWMAHEKREEEVDSDIRLYSMDGKVEVIGNIYEEKQKSNK